MTPRTATRRGPWRPHVRGASAFVAAVALHGALVVAVRQATSGARPHAAHPAELEIDVVTLPEHSVSHDEPFADAEPPSRALTAPSVAAAGRVAASATVAAPEAPAAAPPAEAPPESAAPAASAARRPVDLGLGGGILRDALLDPSFAAPEKSKPSIGLLAEGLAQSDAAKGLSRSSGAVSAGYQAASAVGPAVGIALFDVRADANGIVVSVNLVSEGPDQGRWAQVADAMRRDLSKRKLRVPPGAAGLLTRLRIERGQLAGDPSAMSRLERGPAMGQGALPPRQAADESTQRSQNGGFSPTAQVFSSEKKARATRVVVLSERVL